MDAVIAPDQLRVIRVAPKDRRRNPIREGVARPVLPNVPALHAELTDEWLRHRTLRVGARRQPGMPVEVGFSGLDGRLVVSRQSVMADAVRHGRRPA